MCEKKKEMGLSSDKDLPSIQMELYKLVLEPFGTESSMMQMLCY
jgi:hypothetical protein